MNKKAESKARESWAAAGWDMLYLVQCGINSVVPDPERVAKMDLEEVYSRSKKQSLDVLAFMALESLLQSNPQAQVLEQNQVFAPWNQAKNKAIARTLMMDAAREELFAHLEERGIWHVALKGVVLCHMYPKYGMRQMADNDILFDPSFRQEVHDWFVEHGYEVESFEKSNHDVYLKNPVYNFEMHTALFEEQEQLELTQYYRSIKDKLVPKPGKSYEYCMTDEDFYLYMIAHCYKHYYYAGMGLRALIDLYVYCRAKNNLDQGYLDRELERMGILSFEREMKGLAMKALAPESAPGAVWEIRSEKEKMMLEELLSGSTYGTIQNYWRSRIGKLQSNGDKIALAVQLRYLARRLFPDGRYMEGWCKKYAPYFLKHQRLMPVARVWRIMKVGVKKRKDIMEELETIRKV